MSKIAPTSKTPHILARLEIGFRTDSARLKQLEKDLTVTLQCARRFGKLHGSPNEWNTNWHQQWDIVEGVLRRINVLVNEMDGAIHSSESDRFKKALERWETFQSEDAKLVPALGPIRAQAIGLNPAVRKDWNILAGTLASHLETIQACAQALRVKLELLKKYSKAEVDQLVKDILSKLPNRTHGNGRDAAHYKQEYHKAATELEKERHKFLGFVDVVKGLLIWVETAEERARKNLSLEVDRA